MGKLRVVIPVILALSIAAAGSLFLYRYMKGMQASSKAVKVESEAVPILVAAIDLPWGTKISQDMLKTVHFLKGSLPLTYFSDPSELVERVIITPLKQNDPFTESRLAPTDVKVGGVAAILSPGKRAIAVKGDKVIGISGFIKPGDRVDVLVTLKDPETKMATTKIVLNNILILAAGKQMKENKDGKPSAVDVFTLEVTPEDGEKLALAAAKGKLQFALRNQIDTETVLTRGATIDRTLASYRGASENRNVKSKGTGTKIQKVSKRVYTVEAIRGGRIIKKKFEF